MLQLILATAVLIAGNSPATPNFPRQELAAPNRLRADLTLEEINQRAENAKSVVDLDEATQSTIQQLYERARQQLESADQAADELRRFQEMSARASDQLKLFNEVLDEDATPTALEIDEDAGESVLEEMLRNYNVELAASLGGAGS